MLARKPLIVKGLQTAVSGTQAGQSDKSRRSSTKWQYLSLILSFACTRRQNVAYLTEKKTLTSMRSKKAIPEARDTILRAT
jgi:hypothetical protein